MRKRLILAALVVIVAGGLFFYHSHSTENSQAGSGPVYINYTGSYTFRIPDKYSVDEKSVPTVQLVYPSSLQLEVKTVDEAYPVGVISVEALTALTDHSSPAFKKYVDTTFINEMKKLSSDTKISYSKNYKWDVAKVTTRKDGKVIRFAYLINGKHPAVIIGQNESKSLKAIEQTIIDIEDSGLDSQQKAIRQALDDVLIWVKTQKAQDLYNNAATDLRAKNSLNDVTNALQSSRYKDTITFYGTVYSPDSASVGLNFWTPNNPQSVPSFFGSLVFKNENGKWKLQQLTLPTSPS